MIQPSSIVEVHGLDVEEISPKMTDVHVFVRHNVPIKVMWFDTIPMPGQVEYMA